MNITFFIGNGFDLNIGLHTNWIDFFPCFEDRADEKNIFKKKLLQDQKNMNSKNFIRHWSDFEIQLGKFCKAIFDDKEKEKFSDSKEDTESILEEYLKSEQYKFNSQTHIKEKPISDEFIRSLKRYVYLLPEAEQEEILKLYRKHDDENFTFNFINFNYTNTLDRVIDIAKKYNRNSPIYNHSSNLQKDFLGENIHIHGTLDDGPVLGVNDEKQLYNDTLKGDQNFKNIILKRDINSALKNKNTEKISSIINNSNIICIYGMSIGDTDRIWWKKISLWLGSSEENRLIIFGHTNNDDKNEPTYNSTTNKINLIEEYKRKFLKQSGVIDFNPNNDYIEAEDFTRMGKFPDTNVLQKSIEKRTFVLLDPDLFNFSFVL